jgi:hypothetical protein
MAEPRIMSEREYGLSIGYAPGQSISGQELANFRREYAKYRSEAMTSWQLRTDEQGRMVRANPTTGLVMTMTNAQGQPVMAGAQGSQDPYAAYMNPGVAGADPAADMTNSAAFAGVPAQPVPTAAPAGNPVVPVNVAPSAPQGAGSMGQGGQAQPAPAATPAPTPVANRVRVTAQEFEQTYGRKAQPGTAFPYKDESNNVIAIIEVE